MLTPSVWFTSGIAGLGRRQAIPAARDIDAGPRFRIYSRWLQQLLPRAVTWIWFRWHKLRIAAYWCSVGCIAGVPPDCRMKSCTLRYDNLRFPIASYPTRWYKSYGRKRWLIQNCEKKRNTTEVQEKRLCINKHKPMHILCCKYTTKTFFLVLCLSWQVLVVMTPFQSVLCRRFQFIVAELGVSFCHDPVKHLDPWLPSCSFSFHLPFESCSQ